MRTIVPFLAAALLALPALADEAKIRKALEARFPTMKVDAVAATPVGGIFEVQLQTREGPRIVYSDADGTYIFTGSLIDSKNDRDLTQQRMVKLTAIDFGKLPFDLAVKVQRGNGRRVMAMFTDPYCPYCRKFEQTLMQMDDITVYVFMYPVIRPAAADHSRAVWCSKDRAKAWLELAAAEKPKVPAAPSTCANPVDKVLELGRSLRVNSTPTLFFANGEKVQGGIQLADLRDKLDESAKAATK